LHELEEELKKVRDHDRHLQREFDKLTEESAKKELHLFK